MLNIGLKYLPAQSELYLARGVLYCQLGDTSKGITDFQTANQLNPKLSFPGIAEGIAESQAHESVEALATFRVQSQKHPDDALAQYLYAEALSAHGGSEGSPNDQEVIRAAKLAAKLDPSLQGAHDLLATEYLRAGQKELAIHECQEALKIDPNDQQALYHLILAMKKNGNKKDVDALVERLLGVRKAVLTDATPLQRLQIIESPIASSSPVHEH